jgi:hypothetical protein
LRGFLRAFVAPELAGVCALLDEAGSTLGSSGFTALRNGDQPNSDISHDPGGKYTIVIT